MLHTKFQTSGPSGSAEEDFEYISKLFYGSNLARRHLASWDLHLNKHGKGPPGNATTKFQAPEPRSSGDF